MSQTHTNVAVIGAGIIGTTIAERLQHEGQAVTLIDRQAPGEGCSKGNAGHFASDIILPMANFNTLLKVPKLLLNPEGPLTIRKAYFWQLLPWLIRFGIAALPHKSKASISALKSLNRPSIARFEQLLKRTRLQHLMTQRGALTVYRSQSAAKENLRHAQFLRQHEVDVAILNAAEVQALEPALTEDIQGGLYFRNTAHSMDPHRLVTELAQHFLNQQGQFIQAELKQLRSHGEQVELLLDKQTIVADQVVIAAGAWSHLLAKQLGHRVPLEAERGYHLMLPKPQVSLTRPLTSFEDAFVMTPMEKGLRLAGTAEFAGLEAEPNYQRAQILLSHAKKLINGIDSQGATQWMGCRPSLPDSLPVIDRSRQMKQVCFAFGHQHLGLTQAAVTADLICEMVLQRPFSQDMRAFSIERF